MPIIQRPDLVAKIRQTYELAGPDAIATISPELVPVVLVDDISEREREYLDKYCVQGGYAAGVAGQYTCIALYNSSPNDIVLEQIICGGVAADLMLLDFWSGDPGSAIGTGGLNRGIGARGSPVAAVRKQNAAVPSPRSSIGYLGQPADRTAVYYRAEHRILPGEGFGVSGNSQNTALWATFLWRETV